MCSRLDQLVGVLVLLLQFHLLSSQLGLKVIHLSQDEDQRARGQVVHRLGLIKLSFVESWRGIVGTQRRVGSVTLCPVERQVKILHVRLIHSF